MDYSERMLRREIEKLPDGSYEAEGFIDGFQDDPEPGEPRPADQGDGHRRGLRHPRRPDRHLAADRPADQHAVRGHGRHRDLPDDPLDPARQRRTARPGELGPLPADHDHRAGGLPREPALPGADDRALLPRATSSPTRSCARSRRSCRSNVSAGVGNLKVVAYSGLQRRRQHWVYMDIQEGSYGGRHGKDGLDAVDTLYANTRNNPIEDIESHYPLRVTRYELNEDSAGAGRWRGGLGTSARSSSSRRRLLARGRRLRAPPPGLFGGERRHAGRGRCSTAARRASGSCRRSSRTARRRGRPALPRRRRPAAATATRASAIPTRFARTSPTDT